MATSRVVLTAGMMILLALVTTGCWDREEIKDMAIVTATGLDLNKDGTLTQTVQIAVPTEKQDRKSNQKNFIVLSAKGKTLTDARQNLQKKSHRKLYYSHRRVIIIGEDMAKKGLGKVLDSFHRELNMRMSNSVFVAKGIEASKMLSFPVVLESIPADQFEDLQLQALGKATTIMNFDTTAASEGIDPVMGAFEAGQLTSSGSGSSTVAAPTGDETSSEPEQPAESHVKLYGVGVFKKLKLVGYLNDEETQALNWVTGNTKDAFLTVYVPEGQGNISVHVLTSKHDIRPEFTGRDVKMNIKVESECDLIEDGTNLDFSRPENVKLVNELLSSEVSRSIRKAIRKTQTQYHADVFGFGRMLHVTHPHKWRKLAGSWSDLYPEVEVSVDSKIEVIGSGFSKLPLYRNEKTGEVE